MAVDHRMLGQQIRRARERSGMSREALAVRIGRSYASVARIETGSQRPPLDTLDAIARATGTTAAKLLSARRT